jgi:hypothetical protein
VSNSKHKPVFIEIIINKQHCDHGDKKAGGSVQKGGRSSQKQRHHLATAEEKRVWQNGTAAVLSPGGGKSSTNRKIELRTHHPCPTSIQTTMTVLKARITTIVMI